MHYAGKGYYHYKGIPLSKTWLKPEEVFRAYFSAWLQFKLYGTSRSQSSLCKRPPVALISIEGKELDENDQNFQKFKYYLAKRLGKYSSVPEMVVELENSFFRGITDLWCDISIETPLQEIDETNFINKDELSLMEKVFPLVHFNSSSVSPCGNESPERSGINLLDFSGSNEKFPVSVGSSTELENYEQPKLKQLSHANEDSLDWINPSTIKILLHVMEKELARKESNCQFLQGFVLNVVEVAE